MAQWIDVYPLKEIECNAHGGFPGTRTINGRSYQGQLQYNRNLQQDLTKLLAEAALVFLPR